MNQFRGHDEQWRRLKMLNQTDSNIVSENLWFRDKISIRHVRQQWKHGSREWRIQRMGVSIMNLNLIGIKFKESFIGCKSLQNFFSLWAHHVWLLGGRCLNNCALIDKCLQYLIWNFYVEFISIVLLSRFFEWMIIYVLWMKFSSELNDMNLSYYPC